jgi:hypothetical protein
MRHAPPKGGAPVFQDKRFLSRRAVRPRNTGTRFALSFSGPVFLPAKGKKMCQDDQFDRRKVRAVARASAFTFPRLEFAKPLKNF